MTSLAMKKAMLDPMYDSRFALADQPFTGPEERWWAQVFKELGVADPAPHGLRPKTVLATANLDGGTDKRAWDDDF